LSKQGRGSVLQKLGQVQLVDQVLGIGQKALDGSVQVEVLNKLTTPLKLLP
jgi:hypothetical protein